MSEKVKGVNKDKLVKREDIKEWAEKVRAVTTRSHTERDQYTSNLTSISYGH